MTKTRVAVVMAIVVAVGVVWWWKGHRRDEPSSTTTAVQQAGSSAVKIDRPAAARPAHVTVAVTDAKGPVAGAIVRIVAGEGDIAVLHAGGDGIASSDVEPGSYRIAASADGHEPAGVVRALHAGEDAHVPITLVAGGRPLAGVVTDATGGPIAGARIDAAKLGGTARPSDAVATAITGADGRYKMTVAEGNLIVAAAHPDYSPQTRFVEVGAAGATADFSLVPGAVVEGTVRDEATKAPIAGATVYARRDRGGLMALAEGGRHRATTGADGRFRMTGLRPGAYELTARGDGKTSRSPTLVGLGVAEQVTDVDLLVGRLPVVRGNVVDESGAAVAGARVRALGQGPSNDVESGADGAFVIDGLSPGRYFVTASSEHHVLATGAEIELVNADVDHVRVVVKRGVEIKGHVEPRQVAEVSLDIGHQIDESHPFGAIRDLAPITTAADGEFVFSPADPGPGKIIARAASGDQGNQAITIAPGMPEVIVHVAPGGSIAGHVADGDGKPVAGVAVMASLASGDMERTTVVNGMVTSGVRAVTGAAGTYEIQGLAAGTYRMSVLDRGRPMKLKAKVPAVKLAASEHKTGVDLAVDRPTGTIKGRVIGSDGKPIADAWVSVHQDIDEMLGGMLPGADEPQGGQMITVEASDDGDGGGAATNELPPALTDASGRFTITGIPAGTWDVVAEAQAGKLRGRAMRVTPDATVEITAVGVTSLAGTVHGPSGAPGLFDVELDGPTKAARSFATADGTFSFARVDPGDYTVRVTSAVGNGEVKVKVVANTAATVDVPLVANAIVVGKLVDPSGAPLGGLPIALVDDSGDGRVQVSLQGPPETSKPDGTFRLESKAGKKILIVLMPARPVTKPGLVLEPGKTLDVGSVTITPPSAPPQKRGQRVTDLAPPRATGSMP